MPSLKSKLAKAGINTFFFLLLLSIALAFLFPGFGTQQVIPLDDVTYYGVAIIFFFYGVKISPASLGSGLANWRLHLTVQGATFIAFPLLILVLMAVWMEDITPMWLGVFYLAALPSTVSSSVVMVSIAQGNMPAAIFNASVSSIIGIFITPLWMGSFMAGTDGDFELFDTIIKLVIQVFIPVVVGFSLHRYLGLWVAKNQRWLKNFDQAIILLIVFSAFSDSFAGGMFEGQSAGELLLLGAGMLTLFVGMMGLMYLASRLLRFSYPDKITLLFCGSKKSLVQGAVMGRILFPDPMVFGVVLLPVMVYHTLQLIVGSAMAERFGAARST